VEREELLDSGATWSSAAGKENLPYRGKLQRKKGADAEDRIMTKGLRSVDGKPEGKKQSGGGPKKTPPYQGPARKKTCRVIQPKRG